jgi:nicotinamide mononucleotide adenylyltransferase
MEKIIVKASNKTQGKEKYALYIGRWQPWHDGHQWLINQSLEQGKNVCIAIRDVETDEKNPWTAEEILDSLNKRFKSEIENKVIKVVIIPDIDSINIGRDVGYDIIEHVPSDEIAQISATKIREEIKKNNNGKTHI